MRGMTRRPQSGPPTLRNNSTAVATLLRCGHRFFSVGPTRMSQHFFARQLGTAQQGVEASTWAIAYRLLPRTIRLSARFDW